MSNPDEEFVPVPLHFAERSWILRLGSDCPSLVDCDHAVGCVARLWGWFQSHDDKMVSTSEAEIDRFIGHDGFAASLIASGIIRKRGGIFSWEL
jgi:hypothetical protein